jgi:hypothetical protein
MGEVFATTGGARIGWLNASFPFARLTVSGETVELRVFLLGTYVFKSESVRDISRYGWIPFFYSGIQIHHSVSSYPERIIFWCLGNPDKLLERIRMTGFQPTALESGKPSRVGWAVRWQIALLAVLAWNVFFLLDREFHFPWKFAPGFFGMLAVALTMIAAAAIIRVEAFQSVVLKPGRDAGEIRHWAKFIIFLCGFLLAVSLTVAIIQSFR